MIQIITDSTCDLTQTILDHNNISVVPMYVKFQGNVYKDGINITPEVIYQWVKSTGEIPVTAAPSSNDYYETFKKHLEEGKEIIYIGTSSKLASAIQNAKIAANEFHDHRIKVIDSLNISSGLGILALQAVEFVALGMDYQEVATKILELVPKIRTSFIVDSFEYLRKGGRCSSIENIMGNMLGIKPILQVTEGKLVLGDKSMGKREKVISSLLNQVLDEADSIISNQIMIINSMAQEEALYLKEELSRVFTDKEIIIASAGCVISSHCGPNTLGVNYISEGAN
ncbi:DegV family protein [Alkaliphilus hydrothermalis]|uniref:DegV family protein with EDD domain n=1 Tax=Alkaliphilus hydrothermalis TaxID=1482730 RepID=A0ABS2NN93_9FIRM|nr:DegV family protein [Alkaliphilus hydrothermalis]MBM7614403.1 DegV family protein with EDD domain [Alkaliphilus hydrothermalis]